MAVGDGGFSTKPMGFDKNEVNEYISNLRKKMQEMEAEKRSNDDKIMTATKAANDAEKKIQAAEKASSEKIAALELQVKTERRNAENLLIQIDDLKRKVKNKGGSSGGAGAAEAEKQAADIIAKANKTAKETVEAANKTAKDVVEKAKKSAKDIMANAQAAAGSAGGSGGGSVEGLDEFMQAVQLFLDSINSGYKKVCSKAEGITVTEGEAPAAAPAAVDVPDFEAVEAPVAEIPAFEEPAPRKEMTMDDISFDSKPDPAEAAENDMMGGFDFGSLDETIVSENDTSDFSKPSFDADFDKELIAQTVPSSNLEGIDEDLLAAVRKEEEKFAVQPSDGRSDFDMDMGGGSAAEDPAEAMRRMLAEAEAAFGGGGSSVTEESSSEPEPAAAASNPWEDLQKQLEAMEQSGNMGVSVEDDAPATIADDPKVPSADDSSIWDFGGSGDDGMSSSDDDMSSDLFGSF